MGAKGVRLNSTLSFDENQEYDIVSFVESLNSTHRMGEFITNLIRIAVENPELVVNTNGNYEEGAVIKLIEKLGKTPTRHKYMESVDKKLADMQSKVDQMYDMCTKMYNMIEIGKRLGIESKTENMILAQFTIQEQLKTLERITGSKLSQVPFKSDKIKEYDDIAAKTLEYMISSYEPVINELKKELSITEKEVNVDIPKYTETIVEIPKFITKETEVNIPVFKQIETQVQVPTAPVQAHVSPVAGVQAPQVAVQTPVVKNTAQDIEREKLRQSFIDAKDDKVIDLDATDENVDFENNADADLLANFFND